VSSSWFRVFVVFVAKNVATTKDAEVRVLGAYFSARAIAASASGAMTA
jgi:hypothetical protein